MRSFLSEEEYEELITEIDLSRVNNMSFLVTGASGFLAKSIIGFLIYVKKVKGVRCRIIATSHNIANAKNIYSSQIQERILELVEWQCVDELCINGEVDYVFHTSSPATTAFSMAHPADTLQINAIGTWRILEFCRKKEVRSILFFSSGAVHGDIKGVTGPVSEDDVFCMNFLDESNSYAESKRYCEALCRSYYVQYGIDTKIARISHTYGPGIDIDDGRVFSDFVKDIINHKDLEIKGDGTDFRPFLYVSDAIKAFFFILFYGESGIPYSVANSNQIYTIKELADLLVTEGFPDRGLRVVGNNICEKKIEKITLRTERLNGLGWKPKVNVVEGFRRTVNEFEGRR